MLLRHNRDFLKTFFYQTAPMFLMTLHYVLPSDNSNIFTLPNSHEVFALMLLNCCAAGATLYALNSRNICLATTHICLATLPSFSLTRYLLHVSIEVT